MVLLDGGEFRTRFRFGLFPELMDYLEKWLLKY